MKIFEIGPGRKFRASTGQGGQLRLEFRAPARWEEVTAPDLVAVATNALALVAAGEPPDGFKFTTDERYTEFRYANPFELRAKPR